MILVLNRLQPLSGNNWLILCVFAVLLTASCIGSKPAVVSGELTPLVTVNPVEDTIDAIAPQVTATEETRKDSVAERQAPARSHYNIAVVLTYNTDQVPLNYSPYMVDTSLFISQEAQQSLDFYMGLKLAVENFRKTELPVNLFILDDGMRPSKVEELLQQRPFPDVDLIIGPGREFNLPPLLEFATKADIPVITPFVTDVQASHASPHLYTAKPSLRTLISHEIDHFHQQHPEKRLLVLWNPAEDSSRLLADMSAAYLQQQYGYAPVMLPFKQGETDTAEGYAWLTENQDFSQALVIASTRETFVRYLLGKFAACNQQLTIIGMPHWSYMKLTEAGSQYPHMMIISDGGYILPSTPAYKAFAERYMNEFIREPVATSVLGYDMGNYIMELIANNMNKTMPSSKNLQLSPLKHTFNFSKQSVADHSGAYIHMNTDVGILKWQYPKFIPLK